VTTHMESSVTIPTHTTATASRTNIAGVIEEHACHRAGTLWYYDPWLQPSAPPSIYSSLAASALRTLWIWDPYLNDGDANVLTSLNPGISFRLLFEGASNSPKLAQTLTAFTAAFRSNFPGVTLQISYLDRSIYWTNDPALYFHDRYLFVDDDVYLVGSSLSTHCTRTNATAITKISGDAAPALLRYEFNVYWSHERFTKQWPT
jgi:hypothetical protein